jgi:hypothetical protein
VLRIALLAALFCFGCASSAYAAPLTLRDTGLSGNARSDAVRYLAVSADGHSVTVLDTGTGARRAIPAPGPGCGFTDIHRGTLLWYCENPVAPLARGVTFDLATGRQGTLADAQPPLNSGAGPGFYASIGDRWAAATFITDRPLSAIAYVERTTGQQRFSPIGRHTFVASRCSARTRGSGARPLFPRTPRRCPQARPQTGLPRRDPLAARPRAHPETR